MRGPRYSFVVAISSLTLCVVERSKFQATQASTRRAIVRGEVKDTQAAMEALFSAR